MGIRPFLRNLVISQSNIYPFTLIYRSDFMKPLLPDYIVIIIYLRDPLSVSPFKASHYICIYFAHLFATIHTVIFRQYRYLGKTKLPIVVGCL